MELDDEVVDWRFKSMPATATGRTVGELTAARLNVFRDGFGTPLLTLDAAALAHNLDLLARFTSEHHLAFAPHGKTSMAPALLRRQLDAGAWGITAATPWQARVFRAFGIPRILLANEVVDAPALRWLAAEQDADPDFRAVAYVDSARGVRLMDDALRDSGRPLDVLLELGGAGGRSGVRNPTTADEVAAALTRSPRLRLVGVAGYEGALVTGDGPAALDAVRDYLRRLVSLAERLDRSNAFAAEQILITAGGSHYVDAVADVLTTLPPLSRPALPILRSGAYVTHDHGVYAANTPFDRLPGAGLAPALRLWAQVISRPEPTLALLNAGRRDVSFDEGLPLPLLVRSSTTSPRPVTGMAVTRLADQHAFVDLPAADPLAVGDWVGLGLSHPCTAFDKWTLIPEIEDDGTVTGYVRTFF